MRDYNFFEAYQKKRNVNIDVKSPVFLGIIVIILILAVSGGILAQRFILAARLVSETGKLTELQSSPEYQEAIKLQTSISSMEQYDQNASIALDRVRQGEILNTKFLQKLTQLMPSTVSLQSINLTRQTATMIFNVPNRKAAAELLDGLDQSGLFLQTTLVSVTSGSDSPGYTADINAVVKAGEKK